MHQACSMSKHDHAWVTFCYACSVSLSLVSAPKASEKQRHASFKSTCVACCFKMGLGRNASSRAHGTTLLIHCQCANHLAQLVCNIDHRFVQHRPFWLVCGLSRHKLISQCWHLLCLSTTVVHHSCTWQHLSMLWFTFAGSQFLKSAFGEDRLVHVVWLH